MGTTESVLAGAAAFAAVALAAGSAWAQGRAAQQQAKPPLAQAWIDVATFSGMGMPGPGGAGMLGALMGGGGGKNEFGRTHTGAAGRWVDVTLFTRRNPNLAQAAQAVPQGTRLAPELALVAPRDAKPAAPEGGVEQHDYERPKGVIHLYWGCGEAVRPGQPRTLDVSRASPADYAKFFVARRATQRGAHTAAGRPQWPNETDSRPVPGDATLVGEHAFSGQGVPEGFRFTIPAAQDLMPAIELAQRQQAGATLLEWQPIPHARAYFAAAMGARRGNDNEMVLWSSSELPETGMGLIDYQTNAAVDRWLKDGVLLAPSTTRCAIPKGIFEGEGAMLRLIAYGSELNLAHPPRPADPKVVWEPQWAVKLRVKSVANAILGMEAPSSVRAQPERGEASETGPGETQPPRQQMPGAIDLLRGILGR